jgi:hypothetical protein
MPDRKILPLTARLPTARLTFAVTLCGVLLVGCDTPPETAQQEVLNADPGRAAFETVALPNGNLVGPDPMALAQDLYGIREPVEGNYSEVPELLSETATRQVVLFTQVGLPDDSVRGQRHRLELVPQGDEWQLIWAGRQVQCWPGRGHQDWGTAPCL